MVKEYRLPWNDREGIIYGCIIAALSSLLIGGFNVYTNLGYSPDNILDFLSNYLVIWPIMFVVAFVLASTVVGKISKMIISRYVTPGDSSNTYICFNIIVCVLLMSVILTFLGSLIGQSLAMLMGGQTVDVVGILEDWPTLWPRNFCVAFWVEMLIAQPAARRVMVWMHRSKMGNGLAD